jgi:hypothetical protein
VGPRVGLDVVEKKITNHCQELNPKTVQPVAILTEVPWLLYVCVNVSTICTINFEG